MTNVIISGPFGRMGSALTRLAEQAQSVTLAGGLVTSLDKISAAPSWPVYTTLDQLPAASSRYVLIDFTTPESTLQRLAEAKDCDTPVVIGTTGFTPDQIEEIHAASKVIPVLLSANMSLGINVLLGMIENLAAQLPDYDIEVIETHHRLKKDSPSGTALALAEAAAQGRKVDLNQVARHGRHGIVGERTASEIGLHAIRGGDVVGDHTVLFAGIGERIELTHKASSRDTFASGALFAARFLAAQKPGFYTMKDALGV